MNNIINCTKQEDLANSTYLFTSESVTEGHPDKVCDQISDAILDAVLREDANGRVACETLATTGMVLVAGEITTTAQLDITDIARRTINEIGYTNSDMGFAGDSCAILNSIDKQSVDIALGVDQAVDNLESKGSEGAGDQGIMFGFACDESSTYMPLTIDLSHLLCQKLAEVRKNKILPNLRPDGKAQVSIRYQGFEPLHIDTIVISTQHSADYSIEDLRSDVLENVIKPVMQSDPKVSQLFDDQTKIWINPTGRFVIGGPHGDTGLTGRKIIVDTYGGVAAHGGGAFSGKDATKVDRSATYMARYVAKNLVAAGFAKRLQVQLAYAIGVSEPVSINVETYGTSHYANSYITKIIKSEFDLTPGGIIKHLDLRKPIYKQTAAYGHFGRHDIEFNWERLDKVADLKQYLDDRLN